MAPSVVDLTTNPIQLPRPTIIDTNILIERLVSSYPGLYPQILQNARRAESVFRSLMATSGVGIVTPTVFKEFLHFLVATTFKREQVVNRASLAARNGRVPDWRVLYKRDPSILSRSYSEIETIRRGLIALRCVVDAPDEIPSSTSVLGYDEEFISNICRYGLDSSDASILLEATRLGIPDIVTLDKDLLRAGGFHDLYLAVVGPATRTLL